jgi:hypothetical protein
VLGFSSCQVHHHRFLIPLSGVGTTCFLLPFSSITRHVHAHSFYSHIILHTIHPSFLRATSARVPIQIHIRHSFVMWLSSLRITCPYHANLLLFIFSVTGTTFKLPLRLFLVHIKLSSCIIDRSFCAYIDVFCNPNYIITVLICKKLSCIVIKTNSWNNHSYITTVLSGHHHHHQPINVPTAGAQSFLMDNTRKTAHKPRRVPSADWWVLTTANAAGTNGWTWLPNHGGALDNKFLITH